MRFNLKKVAPVLLGAAMFVGATMGFAAAANDLANYPAPFVDKTTGTSSVAIIVGSDSAPVDTIGSVQIASNLQAHLSGTSATGVSESTASGGDSVKIERSSDKFNLGNYAGAGTTAVWITAIDSSHMANLLTKGTYFDKNNDQFDFTQKLELGNWTLQHFADSDYKDKTPTIGFHLKSGKYTMNYTYDFTKDPDWDDADLEQTTLKIMGREYYVLDVTDNDTPKITLLDSAVKGTVAEGETITLELDGKKYEVSIKYVGSAPETRLIVNGEATNNMQETTSNTYKLSDGTYVGIKDIMYVAKDTGISQVEFDLGKGKLVLQDVQNVELNDETIQDLTVDIVNTTKFNKFVITWAVDDEAFITSNSSLTMPGFDTVKISMGSFNMPAAEEIKLEPDGSDAFQLKVPIKDGTATVNFLYGNTTHFTGIGKESGSALAMENTSSHLVFNTGANDMYFVASWNSSTEGESYLLDATVFTKSGANRTTITNKVTGKTICTDLIETDTCTIGNVVLTVGQVYKSGSTKWVVFTLNNGGSFKRMYTKEGLAIQLPYNSSTDAIAGVLNQNGAVNLQNGYSPITYALMMYGEDKDGKLGQYMMNFTLGYTGTPAKTTVTTVNVNTSAVDTAGVIATSSYEIGDTSNYEAYAWKDVPTKTTHYTSGTQDYVDLVYAGGESYADVYVAAPSVTVTGRSSGGTGIAGGELGTIAYFDYEVGQVSERNLIVIGGSAINTVAAKLLNVPYPTYGSQEAWTTTTGIGPDQAIIALFDNPYTEGKVAMLIAGYEGIDTKRAATALTKLELTGEKVLLNTATEEAVVIE